MRVLLENSTLN